MQSYLFHSRVKSHDDKSLNYESFKGKTIFEEDYRFYIPQKRRLYKWPRDKHEKKEKAASKLILNVKPDVYVPFNLLWDRKPYLTINCLANNNQPQLIDNKRLKSEPKNLLCPAVQIEDIQNDSIRNLIIKNTYEADWKKASKYATNIYFGNKTKNPTQTKFIASSIFYKPNIHPVAPNNYRRKCRSWDQQQIRASVDPTAQFWLNKDLKQDDIFATEKLVTFESKREIKQLIREEKLRLQHDVTTPNYGGFKAKCTYGVQLRKANLPVTHPNVSVSEAITTRYADDVLEAKRIEWAKLGLF